MENQESGAMSPEPAVVVTAEASPPPEMVEKSKGSKKRLFLILGGVVLILALVGVVAGAYFLMNGQKEVSPTAEPTATPTASPDSYEEWKSYENSKYSYRLRYPANWEEIVDPKTEGRELTLKSPNEELVHAVVFASVADSSSDSEYRKTFTLAGGNSLLLTYVECDGPGCGYGKLEPETFNKIVESFEFVGGEESVGCSLSLCDCKCYPTGETREEKEGVMCGINCLGEFGVSGCEFKDGECREI